MPCPTCGERVVGRGRRGPLPTYCTVACKRRAEAERAKADGRHAARLAARREARAQDRKLHALTCHHCGSVMLRQRRDAKFCSAKCSRDGQARACATPGCTRPLRAKGLCNYCYRKARGEKQVWNDRRRDVYHRRRAQKKATATGEPVNLSDIAIRDKDRCYLCRRKVPAKAWPHPLSPSLDHVVPLSQGGAHEPANVRLAHLRCNVEKGAEGGNEQLLLIG